RHFGAQSIPGTDSAWENENDNRHKSVLRLRTTRPTDQERRSSRSKTTVTSALPWFLRSAGRPTERNPSTIPKLPSSAIWRLQYGDGAHSGGSPPTCAN